MQAALLFHPGIVSWPREMLSLNTVLCRSYVVSQCPREGSGPQKIRAADRQGEYTHKFKGLPKAHNVYYSYIWPNN